MKRNSFYCLALFIIRYQETMKKQTIKITESTLINMITEGVRRAIKENNGPTAILRQTPGITQGQTPQLQQAQQSSPQVQDFINYLNSVEQREPSAMPVGKRPIDYIANAVRKGDFDGAIKIASMRINKVLLRKEVIAKINALRAS